MVANLRKYILLYGAFFRASLTSDLEFRMNFAIRVFTDLLWYVSQLSVFEVIFLQTSQLGSWTREMTRVFLGIVFMSDGIFSFLCQGNMDAISEKVRRGELDLLLAKPVNSQFMLSFQRVSTTYFMNFLFGFAWFIWAIHSYPGEIPWHRFGLMFFYVTAGLIIYYSLRFFFSTIPVIFVRADGLQYLWYNFYRLGIRPDTIYPFWLRTLVLTVIPVGFIASVPARSLFEPFQPWFPLWAAVVAVLSLWGCARFWRYALRFYSSASS